MARKSLIRSGMFGYVLFDIIEEDVKEELGIELADLKALMGFYLFSEGIGRGTASINDVFEMSNKKKLMLFYTRVKSLVDRGLMVRVSNHSGWAQKSAQHCLSGTGMRILRKFALRQEKLMENIEETILSYVKDNKTPASIKKRGKKK